MKRSCIWSSSKTATRSVAGGVAVFLGLMMSSPHSLAQPPKMLPVTVIKQQSTFDCGPAALATLLSFYDPELADPTALAAMVLQDVAKSDRIRREGFSLLQLAMMAEALGWQPTLGAISHRELHTMTLPALVHLNLPSGPHFSVLVGLAGQRVILADPSQGLQWWSREQFVAAWAPERDEIGRAHV